jgi:putative hemolysin
MSRQSTLIIGVERLILGLKGPKSMLHPVARLLDKLLLFNRLNRYLNSYKPTTHYEEFCIKSRQYFYYSYQDLNNLAGKIPQHGPCVIVANHPTGFAETMFLPELIFKQRQDLKILSNEMLENITLAKPYLIPIDVYSKNNIKVIRSCHQWLKQNGVLLIFPAGEISSYNKKSKTARDKTWAALPVALAKYHTAMLIHISIEGRNSKWFYALSKINKTARVALLAREIYNKRHAKFNIHSADNITMKNFIGDDNQQLSNYLYHLNYALPKRSYFDDLPPVDTPTTAPTKSMTLTTPAHILEKAQKEIISLPANAIIYKLKHYHVFNLQGKNIPHILELIEHEREITFRHASMGTGNPKDGDEFDQEAYHLFAWDTKKDAFVGAYRYQVVDRADAPCYFSHFYDINPQQWKANESTLVCSRTFIAKSYQKSFVGLLCLWRSLAKAVVKHPNVRYMAGLVSIPDHDLPQKLTDLVSIYTKAMADTHAAETCNFKAHHPYTVQHKLPMEIQAAVEQCRSIAQLENLFLQLTGHPHTLPILFSKYEELGFKFFYTTIDPLFSNCIDVLGIWDIRANLSKKARLFFDEEGLCSLEKRFNPTENILN